MDINFKLCMNFMKVWHNIMEVGLSQNFHSAWCGDTLILGENENLLCLFT